MMTALIVAGALVLAVLLYLTLEYSLLIPAGRGLPVLMYHNISGTRSDGIHITADKLELQLMYLKEKGYSSLRLKELAEICRNGGRPPRRSVILTFDDAYLSAEKPLYGMLEKYGFSAVVFLPVAFIGKTNMWDEGMLELLGAESLRKLAHDPHYEMGLHSFLHKSYADLSAEDVRDDLKNCREALEYHKIPYVKAIAYPYGGYPKKDAVMKEEMFAVFREEGIEFAFRIGNRLNAFPLKSPYEMKRIDIKGTDSFFVFKTKLKKGRAKLFA